MKVFFKILLELVVVVQNCNPSYVGSVGRRIAVQGKPQAKSMRPHLKDN
jgi:hypothetical protein